MTQTEKHDSSRDMLLAMIEEFLAERPFKTHQSFGWAATRDSGLVQRLREGKDVTTRVMDNVLSYINQQNGETNDEKRETA